MSSTYTTVSLDRLIEPGGPKTIVKPPNSRLDRTASLAEKKTQWLQFSPSLYATPEVTPVPDSSSSSFPPSPYIVNHKRRGPRLLKSFSQDDVALNQPATEGETVDANGINANSEVVGSTEDVPVTATVSNAHVEVGENGFHDENIGSSTLDVELVGREDLSKAIAVNSERDCECEDFFDFQESMSFTSNVDMEDSSGPERSLTLPTPKGEFYDAWEELSSEGGPQSSHRDIGAELREVRLNLLMEIEKRKQAEESLNNMQRHWQKIVQKLSLVGLTLPTASTIFAEDEHLDLDPGEELSQQIYIARLVSNSIGRGFMRAEVEMEMESQIESKNFEIARLLDRLHYYEAVNHEMSQRNQEAVGIYVDLFWWLHLCTRRWLGSIGNEGRECRSGFGAQLVLPLPLVLHPWHGLIFPMQENHPPPTILKLLWVMMQPSHELQVKQTRMLLSHSKKSDLRQRKEKVY